MSDNYNDDDNRFGPADLNAECSRIDCRGRCAYYPNPEHERVGYCVKHMNPPAAAGGGVLHDVIDELQRRDYPVKLVGRSRGFDWALVQVLPSHQGPTRIRVPSTTSAFDVQQWCTTGWQTFICAQEYEPGKVAEAINVMQQLLTRQEEK